MGLTATNTQDRPLIGISTIVLGLFLFSLQDVVIKSFSNDQSVLQIVVIRGIAAAVLVGLVLFATGGCKGFLVRQPLLILNKGLLAFLSYLGYYMALASLPLVDVVTIVFSAPILVTVMSALMLRETVGVRRWAAVVVGFIGVCVVVGPGGKIANVAVAFAALAALTYALSSVFARYIVDDKPWTVTFYFTVSHLLGGVIASIIVFSFGHMIEVDHPSLQFLVRPWAADDPVDLIIMVVLGANAALGFYCLNKAYLSAPASKVAPFEYTYILWAALFGYLFWSEVPDTTTLAGIALLVMGNLYMLHRELLRTARPNVGRRPATGSTLEANPG